MTHKNNDKSNNDSENKRQQKLTDKEIEDKKRKFRDFLNVMGVKGETNKQSWNDSF